MYIIQYVPYDIEYFTGTRPHETCINANINDVHSTTQVQFILIPCFPHLAPPPPLPSPHLLHAWPLTVTNMFKNELRFR